MEEFRLTASTGQNYRVILPVPSQEQRSAFVFAFHKSGSTLINNMLAEYCSKIGASTFSLFDKAFEQGVSTNAIQADAAECFKERGYIYTGFRHYPKFDIDLSGHPVVLLARDPRDMLVSLYFSIRNSHEIPEGEERLRRNREATSEMDIDDFVLNSWGVYMRAFERYKTELSKGYLTIFRYEDVIYDKEKWLGDVVVALGLGQNLAYVRKVANKYNVFPSREDANKHIRQVHPGNYKEKLSPKTTEKLNELLKDFLVYFEYAR